MSSTYCSSSLRLDCRNWGTKEMSLPERLLKDLALSEQVIQRLDGLTEVPEEITALVLNAYGTTEFKLDLRVTYLRRVHHFCFYAARWCDDEWFLRDACGIATLRAPAQPECTAGEWSAAHEQRLESFLGSVQLACQEVCQQHRPARNYIPCPHAGPSTNLQLPLTTPMSTWCRAWPRPCCVCVLLRPLHAFRCRRSAWKALVKQEREKAILKVTDEKFKCKLCGKLLVVSQN